MPLHHMILTLFPDYLDCIVVSAALYSPYVYPFVPYLHVLVSVLACVVLTVHLLCLTDWGWLYIS